MSHDADQCVFLVKRECDYCQKVKEGRYMDKKHWVWICNDCLKAQPGYKPGKKKQVVIDA